jgi:hypothetical protein
MAQADVICYSNSFPRFVSIPMHPAFRNSYEQEGLLFASTLLLHSELRKQDHFRHLANSNHGHKCFRESCFWDLFFGVIRKNLIASKRQ